MNDRIREPFYALLWRASVGHNDSWSQVDPEVLEKFGELIVRECIDILMKPEYVMTHPEGLTRYNEGWVNGRLLGIEHIKEHFGLDK